MCTLEDDVLQRLVIPPFNASVSSPRATVSAFIVSPVWLVEFLEWLELVSEDCGRGPSFQIGRLLRIGAHGSAKNWPELAGYLSCRIATYVRSLLQVFVGAYIIIKLGLH